jgi:hypothetical protein
VSRFAKLLGLIALGALAIRWLYAYDIRDYLVQGDAMTFHLVGQGLADGQGFKEHLPPFGPTAEHPPAMFVLWAFVDKIGGNGYLAHRLVEGAIGTGTVVLIGLLARRFGGDRLGLVAAALAAVYPMLWTADGSLMSEPLYGFFLVSALLAATWLHERPSLRRAAALGALIALAALTRGEGLSLIVLLAIPVAILSAATWRQRARLWGVALAACIVVLLPWTIFNATRFDTPVLISTNSNGLFVGANCPQTYAGPLIGAWRFQCYTPRRPGEDEAEYFARERHIGIEYALHHTSRWPAVVAARLGRVLDVYRFDQSVFFNSAEGRPAQWAARAIRVYWAVAILALIGIVLLWRRRDRFPLVVLGAPIVMVLLVAIVTYGGTRFRYAAEPSLVVLAAVTLLAAGEWVGRRLARTAPAASPPASLPRA